MSDTPEAVPGHLTFATGGVVSGDGAFAAETSPPPLVVTDAMRAAIAAEGARVEIVNGTMESEAAAWNATHGGPLKAAPEGARMMPSGNWVAIRDPRGLTRGDKRDLIRRGGRLDGQSQAEQIMAVQDLVHQLMITAWSYPLPIPSQDMESLNRLPLEDDDAFDNLVGEVHKLLFPPAPSPDQVADPNSPTAASGE